MGLFAAAAQRARRPRRDEHGGRSSPSPAAATARPRRSPTGSPRWPTWHDVSPYDGEPVPFFKRAQIAAADLHSPGLAPAADLERLTLFADNLVPHVLRLDGVLAFDPALVARIDARQLIEHDSPEEVEIRACALHAVELLVARPRRHDGRRGRQGALEPRRRAALQGAAPPPRADHGVLRARQLRIEGVTGAGRV